MKSKWKLEILLELSNQSKLCLINKNNSLFLISIVKVLDRNSDKNKEILILIISELMDVNVSIIFIDFRYEILLFFELNSRLFYITTPI